MAADPIIDGGAEWCAIAGIMVWQNMDADVFDVFGARHALFGVDPDVTPIDEPILRFELLPLETPRAELTIHSPHPLAAPLLDRLLADIAVTWPDATDIAAQAEPETLPTAINALVTEPAELVHEPRLPKGDSARQRWRKTWQLVRPQAMRGTAVVKISAWMKSNHPRSGLIRDRETLTAIIAAGRAGLLDG
jgi:hypothetical protein